MSAQNGSLTPTSTASTASTASSQIDHLKDGVKHLVEQGQSLTQERLHLEQGRKVDP